MTFRLARIAVAALALCLTAAALAAAHPATAAASGTYYCPDRSDSIAYDVRVVGTTCGRASLVAADWSDGCEDPDLVYDRYTCWTDGFKCTRVARDDGQSNYVWCVRGWRKLTFRSDAIQPEYQSSDGYEG
jgi:hypothetical protein